MNPFTSPPGTISAIDDFSGFFNKAVGMSRAIWTCVAAVVFSAGSWTTAVADDRSAAELLPPTTVAFAEVSSVPQVLRAVLEHPLRQKIESLDQVKVSYEKKEFLDFK